MRLGHGYGLLCCLANTVSDTTSTSIHSGLILPSQVASRVGLVSSAQPQRCRRAVVRSGQYLTTAEQRGDQRIEHFHATTDKSVTDV